MVYDTACATAVHATLTVWVDATHVAVGLVGADGAAWLCASPLLPTWSVTTHAVATATPQKPTSAAVSATTARGV
jgi:hypothetical protein